MKTYYKHLRFHQVPNPGRKTEIWQMRNHSEQILGLVKWFSPWRQYCTEFNPDSDRIIFSRSCHDDVSHFTQQLMDKRKKPAT